MSTLNSNWQRRYLRLAVTSQIVQHLGDSCERFCRAMLNGKGRHHLVIVGPSGCGKSTVLHRLWSWFRTIPQSMWDKGQRNKNNDGFSADIVDWPTLVRDVVRHGEGEMFADAHCTGLLLLDDLGAEEDKFRSGEPTTILRTLLGLRDGMWTVITSNVPPTKWHTVWDDRVADRLLRDSIVVDMSGCPSFASVDIRPEPEDREQTPAPKATPEQMADWARRIAELRDKILSNSTP